MFVNLLFPVFLELTSESADARSTVYISAKAHLGSPWYPKQWFNFGSQTLPVCLESFTKVVN